MSTQTRSAALYPHPFSRSYWRDACAELKNTRMLVTAALLVALRVAMKGLAIPIGENLEIGVSYLANALGAMIYGPVVAALSAVVSDFLGFFLWNRGGVYFAPFMITEIAGSVVFALFLYRARVTTRRVILSRFAIDLGVNLLLGVPIMAWYYAVMLGKSYTWFQLPRILKNLCLFPVESLLLTLFLSALLPVTRRMGLTFGPSGEALRFTGKQILLLAALFLVSAAAVGLYLYLTR